MKRVLLTGASGFIGRHCLLPLQTAGYEIHAVFSNHSLAQEYPQVNWYQADLLDINKIHALVTQIHPTHLLHLAWDVTPGKYWTSPHNLQWVQASLSLLQAFEANGGQRVVMAGTCAEYDWRYGICVEQLTPLAPTTLYGTSKHALYLMSESFCNQTEISFAWGRIFFLYGPHEPPTRLVPSVIRALLAGKPAKTSHGNQLRDFLYVQDVANAFVALLNSSAIGAVNIASGQPLKLKEVIDGIAGIFKRPDLIHLGAITSPTSEPSFLIADTQRLRGEVGWQPDYIFESGLRQTVDWWHTHEL